MHRRILSGEILTSALAALPAEWLTAMKQKAEETDIEALFEVIEQIRQHDVSLANYLNELTENFEYDKILTLIRQI